MAAERPGNGGLAGVSDGREIPEAPGDLGAAGLAVWGWVWSEQQIREADRLSVERLCRLEDEASSLRAVLAEDGPVSRRPMQNSRGEVIGEDVVVHPALTPLRKIGMEAATLCNALGLTPAGRQALGLEVSEPDPPDWLDELRATRELRRARELNGERP